MFFVVVVSAGGVAAVFVVSATGTAITKNVTAVDNSQLRGGHPRGYVRFRNCRRRGHTCSVSG